MFGYLDVDLIWEFTVLCTLAANNAPLRCLYSATADFCAVGRKVQVRKNLHSFDSSSSSSSSSEEVQVKVDRFCKPIDFANYSPSSLR